MGAVKVLILTTFELDEYVFEGLRAGASGFLVKDTEPVELLQALRVVASGDALLSPGVTRRLIAEFVTRSAGRHAVPALDRLTEREREVVALVAAGLTNEEIGDRVVRACQARLGGRLNIWGKTGRGALLRRAQSGPSALRHRSYLDRLPLADDGGAG